MENGAKALHIADIASVPSVSRLHPCCAPVAVAKAERGWLTSRSLPSSVMENDSDISGAINSQMEIFLEQMGAVGWITTLLVSSVTFKDDIITLSCGLASVYLFLSCPLPAQAKSCQALLPTAQNGCSRAPSGQVLSHVVPDQGLLCW